MNLVGDALAWIFSGGHRIGKLDLIVDAGARL